MNVYRLSKFSALGSISQHGTQQQILSNGSSLYMNQSEGTQPDNFQQLPKLIELKCMPKVISDHTKTLKFTSIYLLVPHEIILLNVNLNC